MERDLQAEVVVIGGGLAGLAAAIRLTRSGLHVICLEPRETFTKIVGESLDWSAPQLLQELGLSMEHLVAIGAATFKRHITVVPQDDAGREFLPGAWLGKSPWNIELRTLHLDRPQVHALLEESARAQGTVTLHERAIGFETQDGKILSVQTSEGRNIQARWVVDASGAAASVLGREFNLSCASYGPRKVALWTHIPTDDCVEGTSLYMLGSSASYMDWIWEIPVRPGVSSIGWVAPGSKAKRNRAAGLANRQILASQMRKFPRLRTLMEESGLGDVVSTSFVCRTYKGVCGPNWIIVGEAASQSDPVTGNGVTAALRHAKEGSELILRYRDRGDIPTVPRLLYDLRVSAMGRFFNGLIEKFFYEPPLRSRLGLFVAARMYTICAWLTNVVYSRSSPRRLFGTLVLCCLLIMLRAAAWILFNVGKAIQSGPRKSDPPAIATHPAHATHEELEEPHALHTSR